MNRKHLHRFLAPALTALTLACLALVVAAPLTAQQLPPDPELQDFAPVSDYRLMVGGAEQPAEMYVSEKAGSALLVLSPELSEPVLLVPRKRVVETVEPVKVAERDDGSVDILSGAKRTSQGPFQVADGKISFEVGGRAMHLEENPPLLGLHDAEALVEHSPEYAFHAREYTPSAPLVRELQAVKEPVRVRVYFGSWCPHCKQMLPRILRVAEALDGSKIQFEYYGLPRGFGTDPEAMRAKIDSVPTGVVFRGGHEIGRVSATDWKIPELALRNVLR